LNGEIDLMLEPCSSMATTLEALPQSEREPAFRLMVTAREDGVEFLQSVLDADPSGPEPPESFSWKGEPRPIRAELLPVPELSEDLIPEPLRPWLCDIAERICCPLDFAVVPAIVGLGAVLGQKIGMRPKARDPWTVLPNPWGAIIGRPGVMKSPPLKEALFPLRKLEVEALEVFEKEEAVHQGKLVVTEARQKAAKAAIGEAIKAKKSEKRIEDLATALGDILSPDEPVQRRYTTSDTTMEAFSVLLAEHKHLAITRDELTGWFRSLEKPDQGSARSFFLELYDGLGELYQFDRIGRGHVSLRGGTGQVLGGIQPGPWSAFIRAILRDSAANDGMISRLSLLVWPNASEWKHVDRLPDTPARDKAVNVYRKLANLIPDDVGAKEDEYGSKVPFLRFDDRAQECFDDWLNSWEPKVRNFEGSPMLESHLAKYRKLMPQMAFMSYLVDAVAHGLRGPVTLKHAMRGVKWCEQMEAHANRAYAVGSSQDLSPALSLVDKITSRCLPSPFTARDVYRRCWSNLDKPDLAHLAIAVLEDHGWVIVEEVNKTGGSPRTDVHLHPSLPRRP